MIPTTTPPQLRNQIFVSYSHRDKRWLKELTDNLQPFLREQPVVWDDTRIKVGDRWSDEIDSALGSARVAVLLVTANFLASRFIATTELPAILRRQSQEGLRIIWVPVSASAYMVTDLKNYQAASDPMRPLDTLANARRAQVWVDIAQLITAALEAPSEARADPPPDVQDGPAEGNVVLLYKRGAPLDEQLLGYLEREIRTAGFPVFIDRHVRVGLGWADAISQRIEKALAVVPLLSDDSMKSDMLAYEVQLARTTAQKNNGRPRILPIRVHLDGPLPNPFDVLSCIQHAIWNGPGDNARVLDQLVFEIKRPVAQIPRYVPPVGGALSPTDPMYIERVEDTDLRAAIARRDSIILLGGARQMGKTSMMARALKTGRSGGARTVYMDFQKMNEAQLKDLETFYRSVIQWLADELDIDVRVDEFWSTRRTPNTNLERFVQRHVLKDPDTHLIWAMDEVDRLFSTGFSSEFFGLIRTWHNARSVDPDSEWDRLSILIAYATEPHLFITDLSQSPFNVGLKLNLRDFTPEEVTRLNDMHQSPLDRTQLQLLYEQIGGHPYLVRRALYEIASRLSFSALIAKAGREDGPFGDHLRRMLVVLARNPELREAVRLNLSSNTRIAIDYLYRLRRAGIFAGETPEEAKPRCRLYETYLKQHLLAA